ncbi:MAG: hypothetical protein ABIC40_06900, partial [bacterium]
MNRRNYRKYLNAPAIDLILFLAGMALIFTMASFPTDWDSCQFVMGMNRFSPPDHQPHPPGYFFFIEIAKLIRILSPVQIGNFKALLIAGLIGSALVGPAVRRLTLKLYPGKDNLAIGAALIAIGAPARLFFGAQGLSYGWECLFAVLLVSLALDQKEKDSKIARAAWLGWVATYAIGGGFRPDLLLFFFPLGVILAYKRTIKENIAAIIIFLLLTACWLIPTAISSGGFFRFVESLHGHGSFFLWGGLGLDRLNDNATALYHTPAAITGAGILVWIAILVLSYLIVLKSQKKVLKLSPFARMVLIAYAVPLVLFHLFVFYTMRYSLLYVPLLIPLLTGIVWISLEPTNGPQSANNSAVMRQSLRGFGILVPAIILSISYFAFLNGTGIHSFKRITQLEKETR